MLAQISHNCSIRIDPHKKTGDVWLFHHSSWDYANDMHQKKKWRSETAKIAALAISKVCLGHDQNMRRRRRQLVDWRTVEEIDGTSPL